MKKVIYFSMLAILVLASCTAESEQISTSISTLSITPTDKATTLLTTATPETATAVGRIILGYGDRSPVPNLPLWLGKESQGQPITYTNADGEFVLTDLPIGQTIDVVDDHLTFQFIVTSGGIIDIGTFEYPLIHP